MDFEEELQALFERERRHRLPNDLLASTYRDAVGGSGALAAQWQDKPHRLVYDLLRVIDTYRTQIRNQDGDFAVRLGEFRKKLELADLHGHYNIFQQCFGADIDGTFSTFPKPDEAEVDFSKLPSHMQSRDIFAAPDTGRSRIDAGNK